MNNTQLRALLPLTESAPMRRLRLAEDEAPAADKPSASGEHAGMKMVFGVWRKPGAPSREEHGEIAAKHHERSRHHASKSVAHARAAGTAAAKGENDKAKHHMKAAVTHGVMAHGHKEHATNHLLAQGHAADPDTTTDYKPKDVPEPKWKDLHGKHAANVHAEAHKTATAAKAAHKPAEKSAEPRKYSKHSDAPGATDWSVGHVGNGEYQHTDYVRGSKKDAETVANNKHDAYGRVRPA